MGCNKMMGIDGGANGKWLVQMDNFKTEVGGCLSGGMGEGSSKRGRLSGY